jgi:hypothetical protein
MLLGVDYNQILPGSKNHFVTKGIFLGFLIFVFNNNNFNSSVLVVFILSLLSYSLIGLIIILFILIYYALSFKFYVLLIMIFSFYVLFYFDLFENSLLKFSKLDESDFRVFVHLNYLENRSWHNLLFGMPHIEATNYYSSIYNVLNIHSSYLHSIDRIGFIFLIPILFFYLYVALKCTGPFVIYFALVFIRGISDVVFIGHGHLDIILVTISFIVLREFKNRSKI